MNEARRKWRRENVPLAMRLLQAVIGIGYYPFATRERRVIIEDGLKGDFTPLREERRRMLAPPTDNDL